MQVEGFSLFCWEIGQIKFLFSGFFQKDLAGIMWCRFVSVHFCKNISDGSLSVVFLIHQRQFAGDTSASVHFARQGGAGKSEGNNSGSWLLVSAAGCRRVFRSGGRQKWRYPLHFWADTTSGKYQIFPTSKGCAPVNKETDACTSPANQAGRSRISFRSFYNT